MTHLPSAGGVELKEVSLDQGKKPGLDLPPKCLKEKLKDGIPRSTSLEDLSVLKPPHPS